MKEALSIFKSMLETYGIDIVQPLSLSWYNDSLPDHALASQIPLPISTTTEKSSETNNNNDVLTLLIGNSKAIWPKFVTSCALDPSILNVQHPLNTYIERAVNTALAFLLSAVLPPSADFSSLSSLSKFCKIYWSHTTANLRGGEGYVAMQRMAECSGLAFLDHTSHLSFHPKFGPWFSLRCAIVFHFNDGDGGFSTGLLPKTTPLPCPLDDEAMANVKAAAKIAFLSNNTEESGNDPLPGMKDVRQGWEKWLAVRDAAAPGHPYRYSDDQILYHYTGNRNVLLDLVSSKTLIKDRLESGLNMTK